MLFLIMIIIRKFLKIILSLIQSIPKIINQNQQKTNSNDKIENCLCQINMLTTNQEILIDMIDHIEDKEAKAKFIRKIMEKNKKNTLPLSNTYKFKDIMKQFEIQNPVTIQDLKLK